MTVRHLMEALEDMIADDQSMGELEVFGVCNYGDMARTQQLVTLDGPRKGRKYKSAYSESGLALSREDDEYDDDQQQPDVDDETIVVLNGERW
jgi:hypothetical protein